MEDVVRKIIEIENKAQEKINSAYKEKEDKEKELAEILSHLEEKLISDAYRKVEQIREKEIELVKAEAKNLENGCNKKVEGIDAYYNELVDMWCNKLYEKVLKR